MNTIYGNLEFVFNPIIDSFVFSNYFKPIVNVNQPMLFRPGNSIFINFLSMFVSLDDVSNYINGGTYEIISRVRIGYLIYKKPKTLTLKNPANIPAITTSMETMSPSMTPPMPTQSPVADNGTPVMRGGSSLQSSLDNYNTDYERGLEILYGMSGGRRRKRRINTSNKTKKIYRHKMHKRIVRKTKRKNGTHKARRSFRK